MKLKMKALSLAVATIAAGTAAHAADVAMFPYVVNSATVTTLVSIVDQTPNSPTPGGYNASGVPGAGDRLHWRLNYKAGANAANNAAACEEVNYYLPSSPNDIQTVDIGGNFGSATKGVLFSDASSNNDWDANTTATINYMLGKTAGVQRGVLFVHNAQNGATPADQSLYGEAMILDFSTGAAWGYQAQLQTGANVPVVDGVTPDLSFNFRAAATNVSTAPDVLTFMPVAETTTRVFVTPVNTSVAGSAMLGGHGSSIPGWQNLTARVGPVTGSGVAFDRDENLVSGTSLNNVTCVGAVDVTSMMTAGAAAVLANGGWGLLNISTGTAAGTTGFVNTDAAVATKLEYNITGTLNGQAVPGTFNNGFIMR